MSSLGTVREVWRYPVKSMIGELLPQALVGPRGVAGDRGWAVRDERAGEIRGAKKLPGLMRCRARYLGEPSVGAPPPAAEITLPDGSTVRSDAPEAAAALSSLLDRPVTVWPLRPADDLAHYRRGVPDHADMIDELRDIFGRQAEEPLPDLSVFPQELFEYTSPIGTYFDAFPLHLISTSALAALGDGGAVDRRRVRPNLLVETSGDGFVDAAWCGRRLRVGGAVVEVTVKTPRCVMTTLETDGLPKDPSVLRRIVRDADQCVGVYATVVSAGTVSVGDAVAFAD